MNTIGSFFVRIWRLPDPRNVVDDDDSAIPLSSIIDPLWTIGSKFVVGVIVYFFADQGVAKFLSPLVRTIISTAILTCVFIACICLCGSKRPIPSNDLKGPILRDKNEQPLRTPMKARFDWAARTVLKLIAIISLLSASTIAATYVATGRNPIPRVFFVDTKQLYRAVNASEFRLNADNANGRITIEFALDYVTETSLPTDILIDPIELSGPVRQSYKLRSVVAYTNGKRREGSDTRRPPVNDDEFDYNQYLGLIKNDRTTTTRVEIQLIPKTASQPILKNDEIKEYVRVFINKWDGKTLPK